MKYDMSFNYIDPYDAGIFKLGPINPHRHYDMEIVFCTEGYIQFVIDNKNYDLYPNQMIILSSLITHSVKPQDPGSELMILRFGYAFLRNCFPDLAELSIENPVIDLSESNNPLREKTKALMYNIYDDLSSKTTHSQLMLQSDLYRLCAYILEFYQINSLTNTSQYHSNITVKQIDEVIQYVFNHYYEQITVDDAAKISSYTKEYFCRIFKQLSGEPFHQFLNRVRIQHAKFLLLNTEHSISEISNIVGIKECKTFRRIFKTFTQTTPSEYRKKQT